MTSATTSWPRSPKATDVTRQDAARELLRRRTARSGLLPFTEYTWPAYRANWHHDLLCAAIDRWVDGESKNLVVCMPPQHGKSEIVSRRLPAYLLGREPDAAVITCSYSASLAGDMNRDVQRIMTDELAAGERPYHALFPGTRLGEHGAVRNASTFEVSGRRGFYRGAGIGGPITGKPGDWLIIDDPFKNREEADSPTHRESVWKWYTSTFLSRSHKNTRKLVCHTRWNPDDLVGCLLKQQEADPAADRWEVIVLPAIAEGQLHPDDPRSEGEPLWPERHPLSLLLQKKAASLTDWHSLYQQRPRAQGSVEWPDEHFNWPGLWFDHWPEGMTLRVMSLDPSKGADSKTGDWQALILWGRTPDGTEWVEADLAKRPMVAARGTDDTALSEGMVEHAVELYRAFAPECIAVETNAFQQLLLVPLRLEARRRHVELHVVQIDNRTNKNVRIRRLGGPLSQRRMRFRRTPGTRMLVEQLEAFPAGDHDDGCFVAGTLVETVRGSCPIEAVRPGDLVLTRDGFRRVLFAGYTGVRPTMTVTTEDGCTLTGTSGHPIFSGMVFTPMRCVDTMWTCHVNTLQRSPKPSSGEASPSAAIPLQSSGRTASTTPLTLATESVASGRSIRRCGRLLSDPSRPEWSSTTRMVTRSTTCSTTSNVLPRLSTTNGTGGSAASGPPVLAPSRPRKSLPPFGTVLTRGEPGTASTGNRPGKNENPLAPSAPNAAADTTLTSLVVASSVRPAAGSGPTPRMVAMRGVSVVARSDGPSVPVYNLTVDGGEYFANGFLVHNCDALEMARRVAIELHNGRAAR